MEHIHLEMRITGCLTTCRHCLVCGGPGDSVMPLHTVERILTQVRACAQTVSFFPLDDVAAYPDWRSLIRLTHELGCASTTLSTTGYGGVFLPHLSTLRELGKDVLQLAFHGLEGTHDKFAGAPGAFNDLLALIRQARHEGFSFWILVFVGKHNLHEVPVLIERIQDAGVPGEDIGVTTAQYLGRAIFLDPNRLTRENIEGMPDSLMPRPRHYTEAEWLVRVASDDEWDRPAFTVSTEKIGLYIDSNLDTYLVNWNPYGMPGIPGAKSAFLLGNLHNEPLPTVIERYLNRRPPGLRRLEEISVRDLAKAVGREGHILYPHHDVPMYKWPYVYLRSHVA